jgi:hypothetical protein
MPIKYEGFFDKKNQPTSGNYVVEFKGVKYNTTYKDSLPTEGAKLYTDTSYQADIFVGEFKEYKDPYSKSRVAIPYRGVYTDANGFKYTGTFVSFPSMGIYSELYKKYPTTRRSPFANVVFVGTISHKDQSEVGIYVKEDYVIGSQLRRFQPTDESAIKGLERKFTREYNDHQSRLASAERARRKSSVNWGKVFALAAGAAMVKNANMDVESQSKFIEAYATDVMNGTTSNLSRLNDSMKSSQSTDDVFKQYYKDVRNISDKYSAPKKSQPTYYEQAIARIKQQNGANGSNTLSPGSHSAQQNKKMQPVTVQRVASNIPNNIGSPNFPSATRSTQENNTPYQGVKPQSLPPYGNASRTSQSGTSITNSPTNSNYRTNSVASNGNMGDSVVTNSGFGSTASNDTSSKCSSISPPLSTHALPTLSTAGTDHLAADGAVPTLLREANEHMQSICGNKHYRVDGGIQPSFNREILEKGKFFKKVRLTIKSGQRFSCLCTPEKSVNSPGRSVVR